MELGQVPSEECFAGRDYVLASTQSLTYKIISSAEIRNGLNDH
jgi:hypothetical protein